MTVNCNFHYHLDQLRLETMPTSCNTHHYDGQLRNKWFQIRPILIEKYLSECLSFEETISDIERWLDRKYYNVKRIGRARKSITILRSSRTGNYDRKNEIDVEELLPILWHQVKPKEDIHNTFYEQLCDITGGSCSQGRSTRLFQFLFLFDLPEMNDDSSSTSNEREKSPVRQENHSSNLSATGDRRLDDGKENEEKTIEKQDEVLSNKTGELDSTDSNVDSRRSS